MRRVRVVLAIVLVGALCVPAVVGQDKGKEQPGKLRGQLPQNYGKLGLSEEQKQKIYGIRAKTKAKVEDLEKQIEDVKSQEKKDTEAVLTPAQRNQLRTILAGKAPADSK